MGNSRLSIDRDSGVPIHRQIAESLRRCVAAGELAPGKRLPTGRDLARELGVNRGTVQKAYEELIASGVARARVGQGTFVPSDLFCRSCGAQPLCCEGRRVLGSELFLAMPRRSAPAQAAIWVWAAGRESPCSYLRRMWQAES